LAKPAGHSFWVLAQEKFNLFDEAFLEVKLALQCRDLFLSLAYLCSRVAQLQLFLGCLLVLLGSDLLLIGDFLHGFLVLQNELELLLQLESVFVVRNQNQGLGDVVDRLISHLALLLGQSSSEERLKGVRAALSIALLEALAVLDDSCAI